MSGTELGAIIAIVAGYASSIYLLVVRIDRRLERIEDRLTSIEVTIGRIGQRLDDHIENHPGPAERLVR